MALSTGGILRFASSTLTASQRYVGLIGYMANSGWVKNVHLRSALVKGTSTHSANATGALVGSASSDSDAAIGISHCSVTGKVFGIKDVGGLGGDVDRGVINSYAHVAVEGKKGYLGGLAGHAYWVYSSYARGSVVGYSGTGYEGGLVGGVRKVINSYADVAVSGDALYQGSLLGYLYFIGVENSYGVGSVSGGSTGSGGLIGRAIYFPDDGEAPLTVENSFLGYPDHRPESIPRR